MASEDKLAGKVIVLTGASGFLGRNLLPALAGDGARIIAVTSKSENELLNLCSLKSKNALRDVCSPRDRQSISRALRRADFLINCAFPRSSEGTELAIGLEFTSWLFEEAASQGARAVVNISSQSVYSQHRTEPATEETPVCPESSYAVAKYATELMLNTSCKSIPHTSIRLASLIGPGFDQRVVNKMIKYALGDGKITVTNEGQSFGYLDVYDACTALISLLEYDSAFWPSVFNIGVKNTYSTLEIANTIERVFKDFQKDIIVEMTGSNLSHMSSCLDSSAFCFAIGWKPSKTLEESVRQIIGHEMKLFRDGM